MDGRTSAVAHPQDAQCAETAKELTANAFAAAIKIVLEEEEIKRRSHRLRHVRTVQGARAADTRQ